MAIGLEVRIYLCNSGGAPRGIKEQVINVHQTICAYASISVINSWTVDQTA